jgi:hypothetical protein
MNEIFFPFERRENEKISRNVTFQAHIKITGSVLK